MVRNELLAYAGLTRRAAAAKPPGFLFALTAAPVPVCGVAIVALLLVLDSITAYFIAAHYFLLVDGLGLGGEPDGAGLALEHTLAIQAVIQALCALPVVQEETEVTGRVLGAVSLLQYQRNVRAGQALIGLRTCALTAAFVAGCTQIPVSEVAQIADTVLAIVLGAGVTGSALASNEEESSGAHTLVIVPYAVFATGLADSINDVFIPVVAHTRAGTGVER